MEGGDLCVSAIDERVVRMNFDNAKFAQGASSTLSWLDRLKQALRFDGATQGLDRVDAAVDKIDTQEAQNQVGALGRSFTALQAIALTALTNIVNKAVDAGLRLANSLTLEPIIAGFREYETNLGSIQTILANTGLKGAAGLEKVNGVLDQLNHYSDQTIYNFSEMAKNIGTFTAAGVDLKTSAAAIKGIANLAAISGSNSEQASAAMYQLSQALSAGKVSLEDWNSVVNSGMGGEVFRNSLIETARAHGVAVDKIIKDSGSFRNSLQKGWITSEILTETLSKFTGELTADQLKSMGYTEQQIKGILEMADTAVDAATKVKSMSQLLDTLKEAVGSGWAQTWEIIFGDFDEAKELFTGVNNVLGEMISNSAKSRNELLQGWKDLGGRDALIKGIGAGFNALLSILRPVREAFRTIFPKATAQDLYNLTVSFRNFMERLKIGEDTAKNLRRTFAGFFAILGIGWELLKAGVRFIFDLFGAVSKGSGGFLEFTGNIGDWLVALHKAIKDGQVFGKVFEFLGRILQIPINLLRFLANLLGNLFEDVNTDGATASIDKLTESLDPLERLGRMVSQIWGNIVRTFTDFAGDLGPVAQGFIDWAKDVGAAIADFFSGNFNFDQVVSGIQTGLFAGLFLMLKRFLGNIGDFIGSGGGLFDSLTGAIDGLTDTLSGLQNALNAHALLLIAAAVGILTLSFIALAKLDSAGLTRASIAIGVMMTQLGIAFAAFARISTAGQAAKVTVMAAGLILLATAVRILASSVTKLAGIKIEELRKGLIAVALLLGTLVAATNRLNTNTGGMIRTAAGMVILAAALKLLVSSVEDLSGMDWNSLAKGLVGVGTLLGALALFTRLAAVDKGGIVQGAGIVLLATGLKILASAVEDFTQFNWEQLARGMSGVAVGLGLITAALNLLPDGAIFKAAGLAIVAASLKMIADGVEEMSGLQWGEIARGLTVMAGALIGIAIALRLISNGAVLKAAGILIVASSLGMIQEALGNMSGMTWDEIARGLTVLAASLILIAAAIRVVQGAVSGAAAIMIMALALNMLVPVLVALGGMTWEEIVKGLAALAGVFVILGAAGLLLGPLAPVIFSLAAGIALLGLAVLAAGVGVLAFATGLTVLAAAGTGATAAIVGIVAGLVGLIPYVMEQIGLGLVAFAKVIATAGPAILQAITTLMNSFLDAVIAVTPKAVKAVITMLTQILDALVKAIPRIARAGLDIMIGFLNALASKMGQIVDSGVKVVVAFLKGIGKNAGKIVDAGVDLIFDFLHAIADAIRNSGERIVDAGWDIATGIIEGIIKGLGALVRKVVDAAIGLAKDIWNGIMDFFGIASPSKLMIWTSKQMALGLAVGLTKYSHLSADAAVGVGEDIVDSMSKSLDGLSSVLGSDLIDFEPTISPVLDLSGVKKDASELQRLLSLPTLEVSAAAKDASSGYEENRTRPDGSDDAPRGDNYNFTQNNYSPRALSEEEIYRQTNNLISRKKADSAV